MFHWHMGELIQPGDSSVGSGVRLPRFKSGFCRLGNLEQVT